MNELVRLLQEGLVGDDAAAVPAVVHQVVIEGPYTKAAAGRLRAMLVKLGKDAYGIALKVISDIASETTNKILGL